MQIQKAKAQVKSKPFPPAVDDELHFRPGAIQGIGMIGSAKQPGCEINFGPNGMPHNPLTKKGRKIMAAMKSEYGERGKEVFYRSANKGTIKGVHK